MKEENELNNINITMTMNTDLSSDVNSNEDVKEQDTIKSDNIYQQEENTRKSNSKIIIVSILLVIILGCLGIFSFMLLSNYNNPRNRFLISMSNYINETNVKEKLNNTNTILSNGVNYSIDGNLNVRVNDESLVKGKLNINSIDNPINKERYYNIKLLNNNEQIIDLKGLNKDNKLYFKLEDIFDKFYYLEDVKYIKNVDTTKFINNIINTLNSYFNVDKFTMTKATIKVNDKEKKADKITLKLSERDIVDLSILIIDNIYKDNEALKTFVNDELSLEDIKENLLEVSKELKENIEIYETDDNYIYNLYLKRYEIIMQEIIIDDVTLKLEGSDNGNISLLNDGKEILTGSYANNYLKLDIGEIEDKVLLHITFEDEITNNEIITNYNIIVSGKIEENEFKVSSTINTKMNNSNTLPNIDLSNAKLFNDITEEESTQILTNIQNISIVKSLMNDYYRRVHNAISSDNINMEDYYIEDYEIGEYKFNNYENEYNYIFN